MNAEAESPGFSLRQLLQAMFEKGASDLHITAGSPPGVPGTTNMVRVHHLGGSQD